jgi:hypothetical protein
MPLAAVAAVQVLIAEVAEQLDGGAARTSGVVGMLVPALAGPAAAAAWRPQRSSA